jgi:excinuclease ABC subunit C
MEQIKKFLRWDYKKVIEQFELKMQNFAQQLKFEDAWKIKWLIESLQSLDVSQNIRDRVTWSYDVIHYIDKFDHIYIGLIEIREWKILWYQTFEIKNKLEEDKLEIVKNFVETKFSEHIENNEKIDFILPFEIKDIFSEINIEYPQMWPKKEILQMSYKNVYEHAYKKHLDSLSTKGFTKTTMQNLIKLLWYKEFHKSLIFECNDISHLSWTHTVASRSIIENGKSNTSKYKKFNIKTLEEAKIDDFWSMKEVMTRRIKEIEKTWEIPDLIIIDGWKWQLWSVVRIVEAEIVKINNNISEENKIYLENLQNLQLVGIAKREEELFLPWESEPIILSHDSTELKLVQKIRDEAHRFAITFNRDKRIKAMKKNILESLPGFWPVTRKKILNKYWNIDNISQEKRENLEKVLNKNQIETLIDHGLFWN